MESHVRIPLGRDQHTDRRRENPLYKSVLEKKKSKKKKRKLTPILAAENSVKTNFGHKTRTKEGEK
jgi:hypothetical protein